MVSFPVVFENAAESDATGMFKWKTPQAPSPVDSGGTDAQNLGPDTKGGARHQTTPDPRPHEGIPDGAAYGRIRMETDVSRPHHIKDGPDSEVTGTRMMVANFSSCDK